MTQYADLLAELGAQNAEDLSFMTAPELAPMPIIHAKRLIRRAAEAVAEAATYDQVRVERERRDAGRAAEAEAKQEVPPFDCKDAGDRERARMAADDDAEIGGRCRSDRSLARTSSRKTSSCICTARSASQADRQQRLLRESTISTVTVLSRSNAR